MMKKLDTTSKLFSPADAEAYCAVMAATDPEWKYVAVHDPKGTGYSFVEIYDEEDEFVGKA